MVKDSKIPFYEKLPKTLPFYSHFMEKVKFDRMRLAAEEKVEIDKAAFDNASHKIDFDVNESKMLDSPKSRSRSLSRKRSFYE